MHSNLMRGLGLAPLALAAGCGWPQLSSSPETVIVVQVCSPTLRGVRADVELYRAAYKNSGFEGGNKPRGRNPAGQDIFERELGPPGTWNQAIGVRLHASTPQKFYLYEMPERYSGIWSAWMVPVVEEDRPPTQVDKFAFQRGRKPLDAKSLQDAPRIRVRVESYGAYLRDPREPMSGAPACS